MRAFLLVCLVTAGACGGGGDDDQPDAAGDDDGDLRLGSSTVDFGDVEVGATATVELVLTNDGAAAAPIYSVTAGGGFGATDECPAVLAAGASCAITLTYQPTALGATDGVVVVASDAGDVTAALTGRGGFTLTIERHGDGEIVSDPPGIACGTTCAARFTEPVTLTAVTAPGGAVYWGPACGDAPTCVVAGPTATTVEVHLTLGSLLHVDVDGALIQVQIVQDDVVLQECSAPCIADVAAGVPVDVHATSPGEPVLIAGACTGTRTCSFTMPAGTATVEITAPVDVATGEQWRVRFDDPVIDAAFDTAGNLVVVSGGELTKLDPTGAALWSVPSSATAVEVGPDDTIYLVSGDVLSRLTAVGAVLWNTEGAGGCAGRLAQCLAVGPSGEAATNAGGAVRRFAQDGSSTWTRAVPGSTGGVKPAVAIDAAGLVYSTSDAVDQLDLERTTAAGVAQSALAAFCDHYHGGPVVDPATNAPGCVSSGHSEVTWRPSAASSIERDTSAAGDVETGVATTGTGDVGWLYHDSDGKGVDWRLLRLTGTTPVWEHGFPVQHYPAVDTYSNPTAITGSATGRIAVAGQVIGFTSQYGFVISYAP